MMDPQLSWLEQVTHNLRVGGSSPSGSTNAPLGNAAAATQLRAGFDTKYFSYTALNAAKSFISARKQVVFTAWHYEHGKGVKRNLKTAKLWYKKSAEQGDKDAKKALKQLKYYLF